MNEQREGMKPRVHQMQPVANGAAPAGARAPSARRVTAGLARPGGASSGAADGGSSASGTIASGSGAKKSWWKAVAVGAVALVGYTMMASAGAYKGPEDQAPSYQHHVAAAKSPQPLQLSDADLDKKLMRTAAGLATAGQQIPGLPANLPPALVREIRKGTVKFYSVTLFDDCAEDGDVVSVSTGSGVSFPPTTLANAGTTFTIPVPEGMTPELTLHAIKDGGGGVTVAVQTSDGTWYSDVLPEGATQRVPGKVG